MFQLGNKSNTNKSDLFSRTQIQKSYGGNFVILANQLLNNVTLNITLSHRGAPVA